MGVIVEILYYHCILFATSTQTMSTLSLFIYALMLALVAWPVSLWRQSIWAKVLVTALVAPAGMLLLSWLVQGYPDPFWEISYTALSIISALVSSIWFAHRSPSARGEMGQLDENVPVVGLLLGRGLLLVRAAGLGTSTSCPCMRADSKRCISQISVFRENRRRTISAPPVTRSVSSASISKVPAFSTVMYTQLL